jgi:malonyl-[acp] decarboxylase
VTRVVVTGLGVVCAIAGSVEEFTVALREGRSGIRPTGAPEGPGYAALLADFSLPKALSELDGLSVAMRQATERTVARSPLPVQVSAVVALQAWGSAGLHERCPPGDRLGVVVGGNNLTGRYTDQQRPRFTRNPAHLPPTYALHGQDTDHVATVSQLLSITGEGYTVGGASASGSLAIVNAARLVECGAVDACLAVGALVELSTMDSRAYLNVGAMAGGRDTPPGAPFDAAHAGFVPGQGGACLVLESAGSAQRRRATVLAEVAGYGLNLDANRLPNPSVDGEARAMLNVVQRAGIRTAEVGYVNAHGSASPLGDRTEVAALHRAFGADAGVPWINSTKALTGHCLAGAGAVEAVATVVQLREGFVHPNPGLADPIDPVCRFVGGRAVPVRTRYALTNSFGFGGFNSSVLLADPVS